MEAAILERMQVRYRSTFPGKIELIRRLGPKAVEDSAALMELRRLVHSMAGTGASFGYPNISSYCRSMDRRLKRVIHAESKLSGKECAEWCDLLIGLLRSIESDPGYLDEVEPPRGSLVEAPALPQLEGSFLLAINDDDQRTLVTTSLDALGIGHSIYEGELPVGDGRIAVICDVSIHGREVVDLSWRAVERGIGVLVLGDAPEGLPSSVVVSPTPLSLAQLHALLVTAQERSRNLTESSEDELTTLVRRKELVKQLDREIQRLRRHESGLTLLAMRLELSATPESERRRVLRVAGQVLNRVVRRYDLAGRVGEADLAVLMVGMSPIDADQAGNRLVDGLREAIGEVSIYPAMVTVAAESEAENILVAAFAATRG